MRAVTRVLSCGALLLGAGVLPATTQTYHVAKTFLLGGDGGWDYLALDTVGHRLFIARQNRVVAAIRVSASSTSRGETRPSSQDRAQ